MLNLKKTQPGSLSPEHFENMLALVRARSAYRDEHQEGCSVESGVGLKVEYRNKEGAPEFDDFFNTNVDRWYEAKGETE